jgi:hypothetical protein
VLRRAAPLLVLAALAGCGGGGSDEPLHAIDRVRLAEPPLAEALAKQATQAALVGGDLGALIDRLRTDEHFALQQPEISRDGITVRDVRVRRAGERFAAEGTADPRQLAQFAPDGVDLKYDPAAGGPGIVLKGRASLSVLSVPVTVRILPRDGAVVAEAEGLPVGDVTLFADPRLRVDGLAARPLPGGLIRGRVVGSVVG